LSYHVFLRCEFEGAFISPIIPSHPLKVSLINDIDISDAFFEQISSMSMMSIGPLSACIVSSFDWNFYFLLVCRHDYDISLEEDFTHFYFQNKILFFFGNIELMFGLQNHADNTVKLFPLSILEVFPSPVQFPYSFENFQLL